VSAARVRSIDMGETDARIEHLSDEHLVVVPDDIYDLPPEQLETLVVTLHADLHEGGLTRLRVAG
jgi:hypothetical protein